MFIVSDCLWSNYSKIAILWREMFKLLSCLLFCIIGVPGLVFPTSLTPTAIADLRREAKCYYQNWGWEGCEQQSGHGGKWCWKCLTLWSSSTQVIQTSEQGAAEHIISFDDAQLAGSQVFVTLPEAQVSQTGSELVAVTMEDLFDDKIMLICEETKGE